MVVIDYKAGQLANRLFQFAYFIAHALENNYKLVNPFFEEYKDLFESTASNNFGKHNISLHLSRNTYLNKKLQQVVNKLRIPATKNKGKLLCFEFHNIREQFDNNYKIFDLTNPAFIKSAKRKVLFAKGWHYRNELLFKKHADSLRKIFVPIAAIRNEVHEIVEKLQDYDVRIGVHLRKGDYKYFFEGRWFYNDAVYFQKMNCLQKIFVAQNKRCVFILYSNETIETSNFKERNILIDKRSAITDLYSMATCHYLLGPPSTFTMWASFYGKVPLLILKDENVLPELKNFKIANGVESFF